MTSMQNAAQTYGSARAPRAWQRWLVPEWSPWFRDWSDVLRLAMFVGIWPLAASGSPEALRLALTLLISLLPRLLRVPPLFDLGFTVAMSLQAWGNVGNAFDAWLPYHDLVHFVLTGATAALLYFVLQRLRLLPDLAEARGIHHRLGLIVLALAMGATVNAVYEEYEWFAITVLHENLIEYYQHDINDLFFGAAGSLAAGILLVAWTYAGWATAAKRDDDPLPRWFERVTRLTDGESHDGARRRHLRGRVESRWRARARELELPRWLVGDWTSLVRDPADLLRASFGVGTILALASADFSLALRFGITFLAALAVRLLAAPRPFDLLFNLAMAFQAWGAYANLLPVNVAYQMGVRFVVAIAFTTLLYLGFVRFRVFPELAAEPGVHRRFAICLAATCLGFSSGVLYELYVWLANHALGASYPAGWGHLTLALAFDFAGALAGAAVMVAWDFYGWGALRRLPPQRLASAPA